MPPIHVFVSYSHEDNRWVEKGPFGLIPYLADKVRRYGVEVWYDHALRQLPGEQFRELIESEIDRAHFAILLISQDFLDSEFIAECELPRIRQRVDRGELRIIPILVGPVRHEELGWLAQRQILPGRPTPLIDYIESPVQWNHVRFEIAEIVKDRIREFTGTVMTPSVDSVHRQDEALEPKAPPAGKGQDEPQASQDKSSRVEISAAPPRPAVPPSRATCVASPRREIVNSIGMKLVLIQPGEFMMGSPDSDKAASKSEKPQHRVRITKPFYLGATLVTWQEAGRLVQVDPQGSDPRSPVVRVSWEEAVEFCRCLSDRDGAEYRLPTEAEWEYACRARSTTHYAFGNDERDLGKYAWYSGNSGSATHPVGEKKPNAWGLYDMHGNVWEWCADWYDSRYYGKSEPEDPTGPTTGRFRVARGGSWRNLARDCRSAGRYGLVPGGRDSDLGFRVALVPAN